MGCTEPFSICGRHVCVLAVVALSVALIQSSARASERVPSLSPKEAALKVQAPPGFQVTLFAGEPDVHQPIGMAFDDRGRLWVAENYTYSDAKTNFDLTLYDRIVILEDRDGDGRMDQRKVFWDRGQRLTSMLPGFGGVYATCAPHLLFIPDENADDVPDGPPEVLLDGWNDSVVRHNIVNGLKWGPDGWLYGRHGIQANSAVGKPGTPSGGRTNLNCAIWRYHPTQRKFEVVCQGGTNPWGHDWDAHGELFFINTVIGHLFHGIPGAYYKRMYGEHLARYRYDLIDQAADHYHWDTGKSWTDSRDAGAGADALGGGHAHAGLMIYQGDNWPAEYRGRLMTLNFHGRRINQERLEREGSGIVGRHAPDLFKFADPWFRGIELDYGPDGGVYVLDWSDTGECHENDADGVHRETGRIFKISYTADAIHLAGPKPLLTDRLSEFPDAELLKLQLHSNEWYARMARRVLQERKRSPEALAGLRVKIIQSFESQPDVVHKLRFLFVLHAVEGDTRKWLLEQLRHPSEHVRAWAVRWLAEQETHWGELGSIFAGLARTESSAKVRLYLASALQRAPAENREPTAAALLERAEDAHDHYLPLMLWYAVEPLAAQLPEAAVRLASRSAMPIVREYVARRIAEGAGSPSPAVEELLRAAAKWDGGAQVDLLRGMAEAMQGWRNAPKPVAWDIFRAAVRKLGNPEALKIARNLGLIFGDPAALEELLQIAQNRSGEATQRREALRKVIGARPANLVHVLNPLLEDAAVGGTAARGLLTESDVHAEKVLLKVPQLPVEDRAAVLALMAGRVRSARLLLQAVADGRLPRNTITAFEAREIRSLNDPSLTDLLTKVWGEVRTTSDDKERLMADYRALLRPERLKRADLSRGRETFNQVCASCHKLYGEGAQIGPDLTGGGRADLEYLLENIIDPSAIVPADYKVSEVELKDDRILSALVVAQTERTITLQTPTEKFTVERGDVVEMRQGTLSLMPEGLLQPLGDDQICNLIAYLMSSRQVPLPKQEN